LYIYCKFATAEIYIVKSHFLLSTADIYLGGEKLLNRFGL
jgi:hypothetical protein